jgi:hypothetical protein
MDEDLFRDEYDAIFCDAYFRLRLSSLVVPLRVRPHPPRPLLIGVVSHPHPFALMYLCVCERKREI